jgi:hypothetical protein
MKLAGAFAETLGLKEPRRGPDRQGLEVQIGRVTSAMV